MSIPFTSFRQACHLLSTKASKKAPTTVITAVSSLCLMTKFDNEKIVNCEEQGIERINACISPSNPDFDIYIKNTTKSDLIHLYEQNQKGLNVWPWIWTQHNDNGPHHVFIGKISSKDLDQIKEVRQNVPNVNILIITDSESANSLPGGVDSLFELECGLVLDTNVELTDDKNKLIMLADERILCFTELYKR